ncbi:eukaryotic translation initiation factor 2B subunit delta [Nomia melanderi]|uniref:eukaryotic translation initiation factor 2B subunit delta n=1 Tax=Nomia melanderi TaxID=2448451 RepID=UPI0013047B3E|nr:translation initiation factor eIF-2B subunit delta [Nomia melanderi]XP_031842864.1 translation initiation factor eIF-2B subunit delta [Nomia melanderi]XP_031842865.1 translation initiation factor eIF-2B subunit delta [Nomia melanderi]XP_031842866.1 translation initiation factor eIF-2B subunit delta [Nomia melanderi]XP_031842868.1 translation initiation factor eIF-2B subunit delta [Nomia melanderi]
MMDQEEHLVENNQPRFCTPSTARHLRRKRLHDARKAEKQQNCSFNGINVESIPESVAKKDVDVEPKAITKSKARRLRKKNKTKSLHICCLYCESYCKNPLPVTEKLSDQEVAEKDTEDIQTITKSKAHRLRNAYNSPIEPFLKYIKTANYDSICCAKLETDIVNNLKQKAVETQVYNAHSNEEQTELTPENVQSEENCPKLSCLSKSPPGPLRFENEIQSHHEKHNEDSKDVVVASQFKEKIIETIRTRINCIKEDTSLQVLETKQIDSLDNIPAPQELVKCVDLVAADESTELSNAQRCTQNACKLGFCGIKPNENITLLDRDINKLEAGVQSQIGTTLSSEGELLENVKNLKFDNSSKVDSKTLAREDNKLSSDDSELQDKSSISVIKKSAESVTSTMVQSETGSSTEGNTSGKEVTSSKEEVSSAQDTNNSFNTGFPLGNTDLDRLGTAPLLKSPGPARMTENKMNIPEKTREEVKGERAAKKAAKALAKAKAKTDKEQNKNSIGAKVTASDSTKNKQATVTLENAPGENIQSPNTTDKACNTSVKKSAPLEVNTEGKSKAELRAERRAKQEAQRAVKQQLLQDKSKVKTKETEENKTRTTHQLTGEADVVVKKPVPPKKSILKENAHEINLFKHLYHEREQAIVDVLAVNSHIHPAIVRLGTQYARKVIVGSNARCVALLAAVKQLIQDFERPSQADFIRGLEASLLESMAYLHHCRPSAVSMQNALRHLMRQMTQLPPALSDADAKYKLCNAIDTYIHEQIELADKAISLTIQKKISHGDVILTYGYSSLIHKILLDAHTANKQFRVIVVDGRPWLEGKEQLRRLAKHGIECSYILINALSYVMPEVSKVFLGAHAILANGAVMSRTGTAQVALMARAFNIPVLVACETHKSYERVQTDSIVYNELGDADELAQGYGTKKSQLANWKTKKSLNLLNITYDVTPADLVTAVVTELAILPCTSVPVILRIKPSEI